MEKRYGIIYISDEMMASKEIEKYNKYFIVLDARHDFFSMSTKYLFYNENLPILEPGDGTPTYEMVTELVRGVEIVKFVDTGNRKEYIIDRL